MSEKVVSLEERARVELRILHVVVQLPATVTVNGLDEIISVQTHSANIAAAAMRGQKVRNGDRKTIERMRAPLVMQVLAAATNAIRDYYNEQAKAKARTEASEAVKKMREEAILSAQPEVQKPGLIERVTGVFKKKE